MTRTEQLRTCRKCQHISFDIKKGFICSVTSNYATFTDKCHDFKEATFISKKKVLKPSDLTIKERVMTTAKSEKFKSGVVIFLMILFGALMLEDPNLFALESDQLANSFARKFLNLFWSVPIGLLLFAIGLFKVFKTFVNK